MFVQDIAGWDFWKEAKVFTPTQMKRMVAVEDQGASLMQFDVEDSTESCRETWKRRALVRYGTLVLIRGAS
jgi:hypothetical protein